ncbi:MAG: GNAT family N-acetyltransferase [Actinobacteria bacterium]|nr:GNAT family N-acetyltransferase [Actinomycetota bacterium]
MLDLRKAGVKDHGVVETFLLDFMQSQGAEPQEDRDSWDRIVAELLNSDQWMFVIAYDDDEPAGIAAVNFYFSLYGAGEEGNLAALYVDKDQRRKGIGSTLMEFSLRSACRRGCRSFEAKIGTDREEIIAFYNKLHYEGRRISFSWKC